MTLKLMDPLPDGTAADRETIMLIYLVAALMLALLMAWAAIEGLM